MPKKKVTKHPKEMTNDEAMKHLFHPHVIRHVKKAAESTAKPRKKKA